MYTRQIILLICYALSLDPILVYLNPWSQDHFFKTLCTRSWSKQLKSSLHEFPCTFWPNSTGKCIVEYRLYSLDIRFVDYISWIHSAGDQSHMYDTFEMKVICNYWHQNKNLQGGIFLCSFSEILEHTPHDFDVPLPWTHFVDKE